MGRQLCYRSGSHAQAYQQADTAFLGSETAKLIDALQEIRTPLVDSRLHLRPFHGRQSRLTRVGYKLFQPQLICQPSSRIGKSGWQKTMLSMDAREYDRPPTNPLPL